MARSEQTAATVAVRLDYADRPAAIAEIATQVAAAGGTVRTLSTVRRWTDPEAGPLVEIELEGIRRERTALPLLRDERPDFVLRQLERLLREGAGMVEEDA